jgi:DNA-binding NarL/FixJ family response regulator
MPLRFSKDQLKLIRLLQMGYPDSEIARKTGLHPDEVDQAFSNICSQFKVTDRLELVLLIWSGGYTSQPMARAETHNSAQTRRRKVG